MGSGCPFGTLVQMPIDGVSAHDLHALAQPVAQQTPCAQLPDAHSRLSAQKAPFGFRPQEFPLHTFPATQLASTVHDAKQRAPLQTNGAQALALGATHLPVALHAAGGV